MESASDNDSSDTPMRFKDLDLQDTSSMSLTAEEMLSDSSGTSPAPFVTPPSRRAQLLSDMKRCALNNAAGHQQRCCLDYIPKHTEDPKWQLRIVA